MAELWSLPVIYVIENNKYGMGTSVERASSTIDLHQRGAAHGIPGEAVDGMDVLAVKAAGEKAVAHARKGNGPVILEMLTYRYRGHSMSDPAKYRSQARRCRKCARSATRSSASRRMLSADGAAEEAHLKAIDREVRAIVNECGRVRPEQPGAGPCRALPPTSLSLAGPDASPPPR